MTGSSTTGNNDNTVETETVSAASIVDNAAAEKEDVIYEQVRNPTTLEVVMDPINPGKPLTQRVSSKDNPEHYKRLMDDLRNAEKIRQDAKAAEERESNEPPTI